MLAILHIEGSTQNVRHPDLQCPPFRIRSTGTLCMLNAGAPVLRIRIRDPVLFYPLDPGSGSGMNFFRIPDLGSRIRPLF
jgi:hypothetical protein